MNETGRPEALSDAEVLAAVLHARGRLVLQPTGMSMGRRTAWVEQAVVVPCPPAPVEPGAIIVYPRGNARIAHRGVGRYRAGTGWRYLTWGDGAGWADPAPVPHETVLGVIRELRGGSRVLDLATPRQRVLARWRVAHTLLAGALRHPRLLVRRVLRPRWAAGRTRAAPGADRASRPEDTC